MAETPRLRGSRLAAALVLLLAAGPFASAQGGVDRGATLEGVEVRAWCPWPDATNKGYYPIYVELANGSDRPRRVELFGRGSAGIGTSIECWRELAPGERVRTELLAPAWGAQHYWWQSNYRMRVRVAGEQRELGQVGPERSHLEGVHAVLYLTPRQLEAGQAERWSDELGYEQITDRSAGGDVSNVRLQPLLFEDMPGRYEVYTSLDLAVLDTAAGLPPPERLATLLAWARAGGTVALFGPGATELARSVPQLAPWLEPRFGLQAWESTRSWSYGMGRVLVGDAAAGAFPTQEQRGAIHWTLHRPTSPVPDDTAQRRAGIAAEPPSIPGLGQLPYRTFVVLLVLFALLIGPVNFIWVKKLNRPALLLLTIPGVAFAAALGLLLYGMLHQGIDVKTASESVTVLDQRLRRAASCETRQLFVGLMAGAGLRPSAGTAVFPLSSGWGRRNAEQYVIGQTGGLVLTGDFLPSRRPVHQVILVERSSRLRLEVVAGDGGLRVENGLDAEVLRLYVRDADGGFHELDGPLGRGEAGTLRPLDDAGRGYAELASGFAAPAHSYYVAELAENPFRDDCGIETREYVGRHRVLGVLAAPGEEGR